MDSPETSLLDGKLSWFDVLVSVDFYFLAHSTRLDELLDVSPEAWPEIPVSGHFDCLLLTGVRVLMQRIHSCVSISWWKEKDCSGGDIWGLWPSQQPHRPSPLLLPSKLFC